MNYTGAAHKVIIAKCPGCEKEFDSNERDITHNHRKFCTRACYFDYRKRQRTIRCEKCGRSFERGGKDDRFCSWACFQSAIKDHEVFTYRVTKNASGYLYHRSVPVHRSVAEKALGRPLKSTEMVHHINFNKCDNRNQNLLICSQSYHKVIEYRMAKKYAEEHFDEDKSTPSL